MQNKLMMLLANNKRQGQPCVIENAGEDTTLYIYDAIVSTKLEASYYGGISAEELVPQIRAIKGGTLHLRISSPGGDVFAAQAIVAAIRDTGAQVVAHIDGLAASAATVIATAADSIEISDGAMYMVHCGWTVAMGNSNDFKATAALLDKVDSVIAGQYAAKTGLTPEAVLQIMQAETWMSSQEAVDAGFVNAICAPSKTKNQWDLSAYGKAPAAPAAEPAAPEPIQDTEHRERQQQRLRLANHNTRQ